MNDLDALEQAARAATPDERAAVALIGRVVWAEIIDRIRREAVDEYQSAAVREADAPHGTRLVLVTEDADILFFGRDEAGNKLTFEWGEPDSHGWYTPAITAHYDDNIVAAAVREADALREWLRSRDASQWSEGWSDDFKRGYDVAVEEVRAALSAEPAAGEREP